MRGDGVRTVGIVIPQEAGAEPSVHDFRELPSYQAAVGDFIEAIRVEPAGLTFFVNEEGELQRLPERPRDGD